MNARRLVPLAALALGMVALVGAATLILDRSGRSAAVSTVGGPFALVDGDGRTVTQAAFKGEPTLVFFGYTHCPDVCPTTLADMSQVFHALGPNAKVAGLFVTVDPERDTPAVMKDYLSSFDPRIVGLTGSRAALDPVLKEFRVYSRKVGEGDDYTMDHTAIVYLMDSEGRFVNAFNLDRPPAEAAADLKGYL